MVVPVFVPIDIKVPLWLTIGLCAMAVGLLAYTIWDEFR